MTPPPPLYLKASHGPWDDIINGEGAGGEDSQVLVSHHKQVPLHMVEPARKVALGNVFYCVLCIVYCVV